MKKYKLAENHPVLVNLNKVQDLMQELGISIYTYGALYIYDSKTGKSYNVNDVESNEEVSEIPCIFEYKLTFEE